MIPASKLCGFWCDYQQWFYIGGSGVIFIVILVVVLVSCVGPKNNYPVALTKPTDWYTNKRTFEAPKQVKNDKADDGSDSDGNYKFNGEPK